MYNLLKKLCELVGPSGFEQDVQRFIKNEIQDKVDKIEVDALGNLIAAIKATDPQMPSILLAAHADEIGFIVKKIEPNGTLRFEQLGGFDNRILLAQPVTIKSSEGYIEGVIGALAVHYVKWDDPSRIASHRDLYIDVGASSATEVLEMGIKVGQPISYGSGLKLAGDKKRNRVIGKALDDRAGCAVLISLINKLQANPKAQHGEIYCVFTVQEEVGLRGASVLSQGIKPDFALAVDTTPTSDTYDVLMTGTRKLGEGPCIKIADKSLISHPLVTGLLEEVAIEQSIPYQQEIFMGIGTDAGAIHMTSTGVSTGVVSIPSRYTHTPTEIIDLEDLENTVLLVEAFIFASKKLKGKNFLDT
ncbi:Deblocking aminopeptidase [Planococcus sp. PAMC 21323]|uniref:M42 family metallopeptidase n=1 Tax=Planococcus sp. PAMC 21323 TaxID=1526927 RepID=UPI00056F9853|nr:M42 family metallopeptidase [Planococcus sp. PAMC 21323]AIY04183.1 Deblocking aminopeptidase [Planococcus sp. PAMC 21323]